MGNCWTSPPAQQIIAGESNSVDIVGRVLAYLVDFSTASQLHFVTE